MTYKLLFSKILIFTNDVHSSSHLFKEWLRDLPSDGNISQATMYMGMQAAGTPLRIQIWDEDGGFELGDDEMTTSPKADETPEDRGVTLYTYVPACSSLNTHTLRWPYPGTCVERFWVSLATEAVANDYCTNEVKYPDVAVCFLNRMEALGLQMKKPCHSV